MAILGRIDFTTLTSNFRQEDIMDPMLIMICLFMVVTVMFFVVLSFRRDGENQKITGLSPVSRQHLEIYQGEELPVWLMEKTKNKINKEIVLLTGHKAGVLVTLLTGFASENVFPLLRNPFPPIHIVPSTRILDLPVLHF